MRYIILIIWLSLSSCVLLTDGQDRSLYKVTDIKECNDWYFIYLRKNDSIFKAVSKKPNNNENLDHCQMIKKRHYYDIVLKSWHEDAPQIKDIKLWPQGYSGGFRLDSITHVMLEPRNNIWDIYSAENLKGLYIINNARHDSITSKFIN